MRPDAATCCLAGNVERLFKSLLPDSAANEFGPIRKVF